MRRPTHVITNVSYVSFRGRAIFLTRTVYMAFQYHVEPFHLRDAVTPPVWGFGVVCAGSQ